jgi:hypothetical protein
MLSSDEGIFKEGDKSDEKQVFADDSNYENEKVTLDEREEAPRRIRRLMRNT